MSEATFEFLTILRTLADHQVDFIVVGGVCALLHGAPVSTFDLDLVHSRASANLDRLLAALQSLDAFYREQPARKLRPQLSHLASAGHRLLMTSAGPLDLLGTIGTDLGYEELLKHSVEQRIVDGMQVRLLDLCTLIALKEAAGRDKDKAVLAILKRTLEGKPKG